MEESAQRRERLKAMRMEASQGSATYDDGSEHSALSLSNPLLESTANPEGQVQPLAQSFNYYTNPMAAFFGNKQKSKVSPQISQDYTSTPPRSRIEMFPSPSPQAPINHSPNRRMQQPQGQYGNANYGYAPNPPQGGNFPGPSFDFQGRSWNTNSPRPGGYRGPGGVGFSSPGPHYSTSSGHVSGQGGYPSPQTHFSSGPSRGSGQGGYPSPQPHFSGGPGRGSGQGGYPSPGHGSGRGYPSPGPNFRNSPSHGSGQGGYPGSASNQGRGHWFGNSMGSSPSSGRGRGRLSGPGHRQGRGGGHNHVSAEDRPDLFYNKSMVEDPWKFLEPVIWKSHKKPWLPHSLSTKKARVSESPRYQQQSSSQPSLAEILAASFNEAANNEPDT
ncbi:protein SICKLE-like isoform X2 [Cynara cardunculus var. scolymus]|uniref:protein SICKLE-like isoform X2 n=1 Tax=Cynara cardunculus var. scolymus TaxID=59895 RepID=UPI000D625E4F|nr:protein SICKLE-like isoform X2 [Cynara cardunculus var. scolymus]